ncbi:hypothetical protein [Capnocytophaga leadbetteri]|nr:hypothetical protein [Capnocytophaga leadbetteri]
MCNYRSSHTRLRQLADFPSLIIRSSFAHHSLIIRSSFAHHSLIVRSSFGGRECIFLCWRELVARVSITPNSLPN